MIETQEIRRKRSAFFGTPHLFKVLTHNYLAPTGFSGLRSLLSAGALTGLTPGREQDAKAWTVRAVAFGKNWREGLPPSSPQSRLWPFAQFLVSDAEKGKVFER